MFYFNNKLHKYLKTTYKEKTKIDANFEENLQNLLIVEFFKKSQNYKKYDFRSHQYVIAKMTISVIDKL